MGYIVFGGDPYYPNGGWGDYKGYADTIAEAQIIADAISDEGSYMVDCWYEVVDMDTLEVVKREGD